MTQFKTSSFCSGGNCVEVRLAPGNTVTVRDTKDWTFELNFTPEEWTAFVAGVKNGEFDIA